MITFHLSDREAEVLQSIAARLRLNNSTHAASQIDTLKKQQRAQRNLFVISAAGWDKTWVELASRAVALGLYSGKSYKGDIISSLRRIAKQQRVLKKIEGGQK